MGLSDYGSDPDGFTWLKKTNANPLRGIVDDDEAVEMARGRVLHHAQRQRLDADGDGFGQRLWCWCWPGVARQHQLRW